MRTVSMLMLLLVVFAACSKPAEPVKKSSNGAAPVAAGPDKAYAPISASDPKAVNLGDGLLVLDVEVGKGKLVDGVAIARLNYTGWLPSGKVFDANWKHGSEPTEFPLVKGQLIDGFLKGFTGMREGGRRKILIPAKLGYGESGSGDIPPNTDLLFEVALFELKDAPENMKKANADAEAAAQAAKDAPKDAAKPDDATKPADNK